ncbi:MAG: hypothetical protein QW543_07235 [Sulfolobales archaeon]
MSRTPTKEPAKNPLFWILWLLLIAVSVPWYFPPKTYEPIVAGLPLWSLVVLVTIVLCAVLATLSAYMFWR